jgi:glycosyltransferase involved in cell wall biosynthesis
MTHARRPLLLVTPIMPAAAGNGLAMRAGLALAALAETHEVHLCVVPVSDPAPDITPFVAAHAARIRVLDLVPDAHAALIGRVIDPAERLRHRRGYARPWLARFCTKAAYDVLAAWAGGTEYASVQVNGLHLAPFADAVAARVRVLDLNDDEIRTRESLAAVHARNGDATQSELERAEADAYRRFAAHWFPRFDCVLTAARADAIRLQAEYQGTFTELANGYDPILPKPKPANGRFHVLFVGTLGYPPNTDAARFLCRDIFPHLHDRAHLDIAGPGAPPDLQRLANKQAITLHGMVPDLAPLYATAAVAAVPIRAGGGTRIKILEAFAHRVPVVSTSVGAEGLDVMPGRDFLCADGAQAFAAACCRVAADHGLAANLRDAGTALLRRRYAAINVRRDLRRIHAALTEAKQAART